MQDESGDGVHGTGVFVNVASTESNINISTVGIS